MKLADIPYWINTRELGPRHNYTGYTEWYGAILKKDGSINVWRKPEFWFGAEKGEAISDSEYKHNIEFWTTLTQTSRPYERYLTREECYEFVRNYWDDEKKCIDLNKTKYKIEVSEDKKQVDGQMMLVI